MGLFDRKPKRGKTAVEAAVQPAQSPASAPRRMVLGLATVLDRRDHLRGRYRAGVATVDEVSELGLICAALDAIPVELDASCQPGADLNRNGREDTVEFFRLVAETGCCTIQRMDRSVRQGGSR